MTALTAFRGKFSVRCAFSILAIFAHLWSHAVCVHASGKEEGRKGGREEVRKGGREEVRK